MYAYLMPGMVYPNNTATIVRELSVDDSAETIKVVRNAEVLINRCDQGHTRGPAQGVERGPI